MQDLQARIEEARARLRIVGKPAVPVLSDSETVCLPPECDVHIERLYPSEYWTREVEWLPPRAELKVQVNRQIIDSEAQWCEVALTLTAGPSELYRYFPFCSYVYVDNRLAAIFEFTREFEEQTTSVTLPFNRPALVAIVSELSDIRRAAGITADGRNLSVILKDVRIAAITDHYPKSLPTLDAAEDYFTQWRTPLVRELPQPIFVIGAYRSGTSILTWAIGQHPNIWPLEETGFLHVLGSGAQAGFALAKRAPRSYFDLYQVQFQEYMAHIGISIDHFMRTTSTRRLEGIGLERTSGKTENVFGTFDENFQLARSVFGAKARWVDGTPENAGNLLLLRTLFPKARFICSLRHPFDVIASMVHFERAGGSSMGIDDAAQMWRRMVHWSTVAARAFGPDVVKFVRYEQLTSHAALTLREIFDFLGEARFPKAAATYSTRINSSNVSKIERQALIEQISSSACAGELLDQYNRALAFADNAWPCDDAALIELEECQRDLVERIIGELS